MKQDVMDTDVNASVDDLFTGEWMLPGDGIQQPEDLPGERRILDLLEAGEIGDPRRFFLRVEAHALQLAYAYSKILSLSNSRTRILAHQVESTHRIISALSHRFLIADEVGLGKTIEAGLVIKELIYRYQYRRILIVCPSSLMSQWQNEMRTKFNEEFLIVDRSVLKKFTARGNPWCALERAICSIDFIKNRAFEKDLENAQWDAVIFDESHRLRRDSLHSTQAYAMAEIISARTRALLLLSATPFRGKLEELYYLLALIDRNILGPFQSFSQEFCYEGADLSAIRRTIAPVVIRRTKLEVGGFTRRHARTVKFELNEDERALYDETTAYVASEFNRAQQTENRAVGFVMTVFQKLLDSSSYALASALGRRLARLVELRDRAAEGVRIMKDLAAEDPELLTEDEEADEVLGLTNARTVEELNIEILTLQRLVAMAGAITCNKKGDRLKSLITAMRKEGFKKFLIFTQFRSTQEYLTRLLARWNVVEFHGSLTRDEKEIAVENFKKKYDIMIATEAGGEGRNLQFCNILINYDLPWSPLKIEQRIGRVHRFGQPYDVYIYNFSTKGTVAERVLEVLERKLRIFEESLGAPDVLLGEVEDEMRLSHLFMEMATGVRTRQSFDSEVDDRLKAARDSYAKLGELAVSERMDFNYDEYYRITLKERAFSNRRIERFARLLRQTDPALCEPTLGKPDEGGRFPVQASAGSRPRMGTFDSSMALDNEELEFLAFGHPVVDGLVRACRDDSFGGHTGITLIDHDTPFDGMVFHYAVTFRAVTETSELVPVIVTAAEFTLDDFDLDSLERDLLCLDAPAIVTQTHRDQAALILTDASSYAARARERLRGKITDRVREMAETLDLSIDPEVEKIRTAYSRRLGELREKLAVQEGQMKWYGRDMRGAVTRSRNLITRTERELAGIMAKFKDYRGVTASAVLVAAGVITTPKPPV